MTGQRFGRLLVERREGVAKSGRQPTWRCVCDCGATTHVTSTRLTRGDTKSCGCLRRETASKFRKGKTTHGMRHTAEYRTWLSMLQRCKNPSSKSWHHYGGRGITVCEQWENFEAFYADMGPRPDGHSLDRIDNDKGYYKENCRWATREQQCNNRRNNRMLSYGGETMSLAQWSRRIGISEMALSERLQNHDVEKALSMPIGGKS